MKLDIYLIIGLTKESRHWSSEFLDALKLNLNPNSIQLVDLPGSGKFLQQISPTSMEKIVDQARDNLLFNPEHQRLVISSSLGGMTAWNWVSRHKDDFTHMVMINSSLGSLSPFWKRVQPKAILQFLKIATAKKGHNKEKHILSLCSNNQKKLERIHPIWSKIGIESTMSISNTIRQIIAGFRFKPATAPKIPLLVIAAKHDRLAHYSCSEAVAQFASAEFILSDHPEIGHAFQVDAPELLAETIQNWMNGK